MMLYVAICLPNEVRQHLKQLCYGIQGMDWEEEENFILPLYQLDKIASAITIREVLSTVYFPAFLLSLQGIRHDKKKTSSGILWANIAPSEPLLQLKRVIKKSLQASDTSQIHSARMHIFLGKYRKVSPEKIGSYLEYNASFYYPPFLIKDFSLLSNRITEKRCFYIEEERFPLIT